MMSIVHITSRKTVHEVHRVTQSDVVPVVKACFFKSIQNIYTNETVPENGRQVESSVSGKVELEESVGYTNIDIDIYILAKFENID
ncbi:hypothetical protein CHS0354_034182, partial [Potamilus streckersoni]